MLAFGAQSIAALVDDACRQRLADWLSLLDDCLAAAGGLDGTETPGPTPSGAAIPPSPTNTTAFRNGTNASPIPTTWA